MKMSLLGISLVIFEIKIFSFLLQTKQIADRKYEIIKADP